MTRSVAIIMVGGPTKGKLLLCYGYAAIESKLDLDHSLSLVRRMQVFLLGEWVSCKIWVLLIATNFCVLDQH